MHDRSRIPHFQTQQVFSFYNVNNDLNPLGNSFDQTYANDLKPKSSNSNSPENRPYYLVDTKNVTFQTSDPCPAYTVISYTWGRWKHPAREMDTPVEGGYWKVPANTLFSRQQLDEAMRNMSGDSNIWLDVLCIPQDDHDPLKKAEIGKQSEIFRSASHGMVWLCSGGEELVTELCSAVPVITYMIRPDLFPLNDIAEVRRRLEMITDITRSVPWTTSLWTLQEAALRLDSVFCSKTGHPLQHKESGDLITIRHFLKTLREMEYSLDDLLYDCATPPFKNGRFKYGIANGLAEFEALGFSEGDLSLALKAMDTMEQVALRRLVNMNAAELMRAADHRVCERKHDRVYGIMGAIGVVVPVDYDLPASEVMDMFLAELHRCVPAEIQAFRRTGPLIPNGRHWLVDKHSAPLSLVRQLSLPTSPVFNSVTKGGYLVVNNMLTLYQDGLEELIARCLMGSMLPTVDNHAISTLTRGRWNHQTSTIRDQRFSRVSLCHILRYLASISKLGLIPLGSIAGMDRLGWKLVYIMVASTSSTEDPVHDKHSKPCFDRFGLIFTGDKFALGVNTSGPFFLH